MPEFDEGTRGLKFMRRFFGGCLRPTITSYANCLSGSGLGLKTPNNGGLFRRSSGLPFAPMGTRRAHPPVARRAAC